MNIQSKSPRSINWKRIAFIAVLLGVAAFKYFKTDRGAAPQDRSRQSGGTAQVDLPSEIDLDPALSKSDRAKNQTQKPNLKFEPIQSSKSGAAKSATNSSGPYLKRQGGKKVSPAGLVYATSRIEHVMRHAQDMPNRNGNHGVFDTGGDELFRLLDEAYEMIQSNSREVSKDRGRSGEAWKSAYTINMNRRVGYRGGKSGNRDGKPALSRIKLVLANDDEVVTAYPY